MKKLSIWMLVLMMMGCALGEGALTNVQGKTADGYACIECAGSPDMLEEDEQHHNYPYANFGGISADIDGDGAEETITVDTVRCEGYEYTCCAEGDVLIRLNVTDGDDVHSVVTEIGAAPIHDHTGEWTDAEPVGGKIYSATRVYLYGDAPYIIAEGYDCAYLYGDGSGYWIYVYQYTGNGLEEVFVNGGCASDPYVLDCGLITDLAKIGIGNVNIEGLWIGDGLIAGLEGTVPIAGVFTRGIYEDYEDRDRDSIMQHYEETGEIMKKVCETHVLSESELAAGGLDCGDGVADGWFALETESYSQGTVTVREDTDVLVLPQEGSETMRSLSAGDSIDWAGFSVDGMCCVLFDNAYGFLSEDVCEIAEK